MSAEVGLSVTQRRYVKYGDAHYGGNLVDGAYVLGLFGDVATELCIVTDGDEGLFASYSDVQFRAPVRAGDMLDVSATVVRVGRRSRELEFVAKVVCRGRPDRSASATIAQLLSHTAGLPSETPGPWWERSPGDLRPGLGDILGPAPHPAGRRFHYSNPGYGLFLAHQVAKEAMAVIASANGPSDLGTSLPI